MFKFFEILINLCFLIFLFVSVLSAQEVRQVRKTILEFKDELKLSNTQVKEIEKILSDFHKSRSGLIEEIKRRDKRLNELLQKEGDINEIKKEVREIYRLRGEAVAEELEAARKIDGLLTEEQKKRWREIRMKSLKKSE